MLYSYGKVLNDETISLNDFNIVRLSNIPNKPTVRIINF
jgi:hypothetical protein